MRHKNAKIFIADDDADILQIIAMMLQTQGYNVDISNNANDIFSYAEEDLPELILLDIWMSGIDGREICARLKKNPATKNIPILFISANSSIEEIAKEFKADGFIAKPFEMDYLLKRISKIVEERRAANGSIAAG